MMPDGRQCRARAGTPAFRLVRLGVSDAQHPQGREDGEWICSPEEIRLIQGQELPG